MITSKLTTKARTTIPQSIREALQLRPGDKIVYRIERTCVVLAKASGKRDDPFVVFTEWASENDERAYAKL